MISAFLDLSCDFFRQTLQVLQLDAEVAVWSSSRRSSITGTTIYEATATILNEFIFHTRDIFGSRGAGGSKVIYVCEPLRHSMRRILRIAGLDLLLEIDLGNFVWPAFIRFFGWEIVCKSVNAGRSYRNTPTTKTLTGIIDADQPVR